MENKYNKKCCICELTQTESLKAGQGGMFLAVFPTDADKRYDGKPQPICRVCWKKFIDTK